MSRTRQTRMLSLRLFLQSDIMLAKVKEFFLTLLEGIQEARENQARRRIGR